ncbi:MAG TPA: helix-turn-helix domain-containing protein [Solirubrobacteraceae bacterium]
MVRNIGINPEDGRLPSPRWGEAGGPEVTYDGAVAVPLELPVAPGARAERIDAVRNREAILEAARRLLSCEGTESITMDRLACEAGVGKGTLFRRFGDRAGLFHALLDETERRLQEGFIRGPAPLGPGAPPGQRLTAFGHELLALTQERGDLLLAATPSERGSRFRSPVHAAYRAHISSLLIELDCDEWDYMADVLLAALEPELVLHQLERGATLAELSRAWEELVRRSVT